MRQKGKSKKNKMRKKVFLLIAGWFACSVLLIESCTGADNKRSSTSEIVLVASTPGDSLVKSMLHIDAGMDLDFIRWNLTIGMGRGNTNTWLLKVHYGKSRPNTIGFDEDALTRTLQGKYDVIDRGDGSLRGKIYRLTSSDPRTTISLVKLNDNIFHLLTPDNKLMVGNGGWSYTLNRQNTLTSLPCVLPSLSDRSTLPDDVAQEVIFEGRTPSREFERAYGLQVFSAGNKIKWRLTLYRDSVTMLPAKYNLSRTGIEDRTSGVEGTWAIIEGTEGNPDAVIYQLDPDRPAKSIYFYVGSEDVLFFLDRDQKLLTGNADFSFTLNRRPKNR